MQRKHAILRNFPIIGHFRYLLEAVGPELRQYIVTNNNEERPFSRDQRRWVYTSSKQRNEYFGFGSDNELELANNYIIVKPSVFPYQETSGRNWKDENYPIPAGKILGGSRQRKQAFRPPSIISLSGMSFGSLSGPAVQALNRGANLANCLHNTGEGGVSIYHQHGGELIWQIGTGYFGCRDDNGKFDLTCFKETIAKGNIRAIEIKLSQGAKPGLGGVLPAAKVTSEIAKARRISMAKVCISPSTHSAFYDADQLLDFVEMLAEETGLPVGIKSAVGDMEFWQTLAKLMESGDRGVDFIAIDGGEGGTGAAPLVFSDHVALPFKIGFHRVYKEFAKRELHEKVFFIGSGKLGFPESAIFALALGCDMIAVGREALLAIGCIQAQRCHTNHCPTGVATQSKWLMRGLDPTSKAARLANYITTLRKEIMRVTWACGVSHPALIRSHHIEILDGRFGSHSIEELFGYEHSWGSPSDKDCKAVQSLMI